jgi:predicted metal-dependent phosphoesterase TrpH
LPVKIDLHVHSHYSSDSIITPQKLQVYSIDRGLDAVAITDHDRLDSAYKIAKEVDIPVIPGLEISSSGGHITGLYVSEVVPPRLSIEETVDRIHKAGGIAVACHPGSILKRSIDVSTDARFDAVEVINASAFPFRRSVKIGEEMSSRLDAARVGGSDAHYGSDIGCAYTIVDAEVDSERIIKAIRGHRCRPMGRAISLSIRTKRKLFATFVK